MGTSTLAASAIIPPTMDLEDLFLHFLSKFDGLPSPRSVAEARIEPGEVSALAAWFSQRWGVPRMWCENTWPVKIADGVAASDQEMFGGLLLILASEICRDKSTEDS